MFFTSNYFFLQYFPLEVLFVCNVIIFFTFFTPFFLLFQNEKKLEKNWRLYRFVLLLDKNKFVAPFFFRFFFVRLRYEAYAVEVRRNIWFLYKIKYWKVIVECHKPCSSVCDCQSQPSKPINFYRFSYYMFLFVLHRSVQLCIFTS